MADYQKLRRLGKGFYGEVWLAHDRALNERRAVKLVSPTSITNPTDFYHEPKLLKELQHSNIVRVEDAGKTVGGTLYIAMEYLERGSLEDIFKGGPVLIRKVKVILCSICRALEYAHYEKNVIHRDIKPANILVGDDGLAKLSDFGLASRIPDSGSVRFKQAYLLHVAPEAYLTRVMTVLSDIYALGVTAYRLLNGDSYLPEYTDNSELADMIVDGSYPNRQRYRPCIPSQIRRVMNKAMNLEPSKRFQCASEFRRALEAIDLKCQWGWSYRGRAVTYRTKIRKEGRSTIIKVVVGQKQNRKFDIITNKRKPTSKLRKVNKDCFYNLTKPQMKSNLRKTLSRYIIEGK